ncbi:RNA/RNP complex-1-interacting phosphatase [Ictalurus furcatus]|uniref:RNA/RNP complex-1-interacting phosphatase n=1 Tax=Ictalurus furcatus TaxID=66913 RepID=UPI00234FBACF|nr:RNA/RNP complex-1-interacting phosphatase [Ictalurus furcatus]
MGPKKKNGIPDRWTDYKAVGKRIPGTRFIAFKVPLKQALRRHLSESEVFGPFELMDVLKKEGEELGLIIDLTFTTRYYQPQDLPDTLHYLKIFTAGHEVPSDSTILSFKKAVRRFLHDNQNNDKLIGVHCTHGLNRSGYLVCRYMIDVDGVEPHDAIDLFNKSRGHSIERQNYLKDLKSGPKRSNDGMDEPEQEPVRGGATNRTHELMTSFCRRDDHQDHFEPFNQSRRNNQKRPCPPPLFHTHPHRGPPPLLFTPPFRGPPPLLPTPPPLLPTPPPLDAWSAFRQGRYPAPPPDPTFMPRYTFGEQPRRTHRKKRRSAHKYSTNSP